MLEDHASRGASISDDARELIFSLRQHRPWRVGKKCEEGRPLSWDARKTLEVPQLGAFWPDP